MAGHASDTTPGTVLVANPSADLYGSDRMVLEAVRGLTDLGWKVIVTCSQEGPLVRVLRDEEIDVRVLEAPVVRKSMLSPKGILRLSRDISTQVPRMRRLIRETRPDVVLSNTVTIPFWTVAGRTTRRPVVVYVHEAESALSRPARTLLTAPLRFASAIVFNSQTSRQVSRVKSLEKADRTTVLHNGLRGPDAVAEARRELDGSLRVVYVGRLSPRKGVDLAIRAVALLRRDGIEATLDIVGDVFPGYEWYESELRELVRELAVEDAVVFSGFEPAVWGHLAAADVAVVPSRLDESFGNVLVEAILSARPVVAADQAGLREASEGFGAAVLVQPDDERALTEGLRRVYEQWPDYRERAREDAAHARERNSPSAFHRRLSEFLGRWARG